MPRWVLFVVKINNFYKQDLEGFSLWFTFTFILETRPLCFVANTSWWFGDFVVTTVYYRHENIAPVIVEPFKLYYYIRYYSFVKYSNCLFLFSIWYKQEMGIIWWFIMFGVFRGYTIPIDLSLFLYQHFILLKNLP